MSGSSLRSAVDKLTGFEYVHDSYGLDVALSRVVDEEGTIPVGTDSGFSEEEFASLGEVYRSGIFGSVLTKYLPDVVEEYRESDVFHQQVSNLPGENVEEYIISDGPQYFFNAKSEIPLESGVFNTQSQSVEKVFHVEDETVNWGQDESAIEYDKVEALNQVASELPDDLVIPEHDGEAPFEQIGSYLDEEQKQVLSDTHVWGLDIDTLETVTEEILEDPRYQQATENMDAFNNQTVMIYYNDTTPTDEDLNILETLYGEAVQEISAQPRIDSRIEIKFSRSINPQIVKRHELKR